MKFSVCVEPNFLIFAVQSAIHSSAESNDTQAPVRSVNKLEIARHLAHCICRLVALPGSDRGRRQLPVMRLQRKRFAHLEFFSSWPEAIDPVTGETKASRKLDYPNLAGALATAGNLVFLGHYDGTFAAYDARTLNEMWSFNVGSPIQAPPIS